jgi:hypothetical protein
VRKILTHIREALPLGALGPQIPVHQGFQGVRVFLGEPGDGRLADNPQVSKLPEWEPEVNRQPSKLPSRP